MVSAILLLGALLNDPGAWSDNELQFRSDDPKLHVRRSEHFRIVWGRGEGEGGVAADFDRVTEQLAQGNLQMLEQVWRVFHGPSGLGFPIPSQPIDPAKRDGRHYRANLVMNNTGIWEGGAWGSIDDRQLPLFALPPTYLAFDPPSGATPHEYGHTVQINAAGFNDTPWDGMWHEAGANWLMLQFNNAYPGPGGVGNQPYLSLPHGRNYYDAWQLFEVFREDARFGSRFLGRLWSEARGGKAKGAEYIFDAMVRLMPKGIPDPYNELKDLMGQNAARAVTWDFQRGPFFRVHSPRTSDPLSEMYRRASTELEPMPGKPGWYRGPFSQAPMQGGYNMVPIELVGKGRRGGYKVGVDFRPLWDPSRRSDWRATLVAVSDDGRPRYSPAWNGGRNAITLSADENRLYLVVCATPDFLPFEGFSHPKPTEPVLQPQAYTVSFFDTKARPWNSKPAPPAGVEGHRHPNGGGFVASTATVAPSAYVGPEAMVLDRARVEGTARVAGRAVVRGEAVVADQAVVSDHALVQDRAQILGRAKVRDWATVGGAWKVQDDARVLEHAFLLDRGEARDRATLQGVVADYGGAVVSGYASKQGDCANSASIDRQALMCWVWGIDQKYADSQPDTGALYAGYDFEKPSPILARDRFGLVHGFLVGGASVRPCADPRRGRVLALDGKEAAVELPKSATDLREATYALWFRWRGGPSTLLRIQGRGDDRLTLTAADDQGRIAVVARAGRDSLRLVGPKAVPGRWTHAAVTFRDGVVELVVDGRTVATARSQITPDRFWAEAPGEGGAWLGRGFAGQVDDFRCYVAPRSAEQLAALAGEVSKRDAGLVAAGPTKEAAFRPGWLVPPRLVRGPAVVLSATRPPKAPPWLEYRFDRSDGATSGWISSNRWFDPGVVPGRRYRYTVWSRTAPGQKPVPSPSVEVAVPADRQAPQGLRFASEPRGVADGAIAMEAGPVEDRDALVEYLFRREDGVQSGWQASPSWIDRSAKPGSSHRYTVQVRDSSGNVSAPVACRAVAVARDDTPPARYVLGEWRTRPIALLDNRVLMRAMDVAGRDGCPKIEDGPVEYLFESVDGRHSSGWIRNPVWQTPPLADGVYAFRFKIRDLSPQRNETGWSAAEPVRVSPLTGYHRFPLGRVAGLEEGTLVETTATVAEVKPDSYVLEDAGARIVATNRARALKTDASLLGKRVRVQGCAWKVAGEKRLVWCDLQPE